MPTDRASRGTLRVLFVEDSEDDLILIVRYLERLDYAVEHFRVETRDGFERAIDNAVWDVVISDHSMPHFSSLDALAAIKLRELDRPFIIVSGTIGEEMAVEAMRAGAHDYVLKNNLARLAPAIERELSDAELRKQAREERATRRDIQRQLQQAQKMEAVGRLAGGIAHDFNNLLTAILGFSSLALERLDASGNVRFELEQVRQAAERGARLTRQLLAFSRQQVLAMRLVDPAEAVEAMAPMLRQLLGEDVELHTIATPGAGRIKVDPGQFEQVIMNLAVNARDAMPNGGSLTLETARVDIAAPDALRLQLKPGAYMRIAANDSGMGIDDAVRGRIFEPFFTTKPPGQGTGLGLSTVYGILQQTGGSIDVDSRVGEGSTFNVYLPLAEEKDDVVTAQPRRTRPAAEHHGTVFIAEDDDSVRVLVCRVLMTAGYRVLEARTGTEAAALLETLTDPIDLLITDVVMPGMVGPDLARLALHRFQQTRVLYITGYATPSSIPPQFLQDDDALMQKPFLPEQLLARVQERLGDRT